MKEYDALQCSANYENFLFRKQEELTLGNLQEVSDIFISRLQPKTPHFKLWP